MRDVVVEIERVEKLVLSAIQSNEMNASHPENRIRRCGWLQANSANVFGRKIHECAGNRRNPK